MAKYIAKRVALAIVTLLVLTSVVFVLVRLMPGDPFSSDKMTPEIKANLEAYYGLDKPLAEQYITYMKNVLHGDLGYSMKYESQTVNRIIADSFPYSADLGIRSLCFALFFGLILGIVAALNRGKKLDFVCILIAIIGTSIPDFIMGSVLQYFFGIKWQILPVAQYTSFKHTILPSIAINPARDLGPRLAHAVLPIKGKGDSNFGYGLVVPIIGPIIGAIAAVLLYGAIPW